MSRVAIVTHHQHETNIAENISQLLNSYSLEALHNKISKLSLINLYKAYQQLSAIEQTQLLKQLPLIEKIDLTLLTHRTKPAIELITQQPSLVVNTTHPVGLVKKQLQGADHQPIIVVDDSNQYHGIVDLQQLVNAPDTCLMSTLVHSRITKLHVSEHQHDAATIIANNNDHFAVLVDKQDRLVGLLQLADLVKVTTPQNEQADTRPYLKIPVLSHVRQRIFWILALAVVGLLSGIIIQSYDDAIAALIILAFYMPMVADTGGNAGSQAATVIIRSIALGELKLQNWFAILYKELRIAIFIGLGLAAVSYMKIYFLSYGIELPEGLTLSTIALAIAIALFVQVLTATTIGASLPLIVKLCKQDPAVVASPAITTVVDITGLLIYFYITSSLLLY